MALYLSSDMIDQIHRHGEAAYPEEGAGLMLGVSSGEHMHAFELLTFNNAREQSARYNRYLLTPKDYLLGEREADRQGLEVIGVFHSHPDHPNQPSEFDREWAMPSLSYLITGVELGKAAASRSWRLSEDRAQFTEEPIRITGQDENLEDVPHLYDRSA